MDSSVERFQNSQWQKLNELNFSKEAVLSILEKGKDGSRSAGKVLDIGCGDGILLERLKERGITGVGIDISSAAVNICKSRGLDCRQADITATLPFPDNSFDAVILTDVLEHIFQPRELLKEVHRVCRGSVLISVPNFSSLPARIQLLFGRVPENNTPRDGHVYWMTLVVVRDLLEKAGFEIELMIVNTFWEQNPVIGWLMKFLKRARPSLFALSFIIKARKV